MRLIFRRGRGLGLSCRLRCYPRFVRCDVERRRELLFPVDGDTSVRESSTEIHVHVEAGIPREEEAFCL